MSASSGSTVRRAAYQRCLAAIGATAAIAAALASASPQGANAAETSVPRRTLTVFAAASLTDAFDEIARAFERERGVRVRVQYAGSQQLAAQLEQGASADVFASADARWMDFVRARGMLADSARVFARNALVVIVPKTNPGRIDRLGDLDRRGVKVIVGAEAVPVGAYAREALRRMSESGAFGPDFASQVLRNVVSQEENVRSIVSKVQLGEADAGLVYRSDVTRATARHVRVLELPAATNVLASYPLAVLKDSPSPDLARQFVQRVLSPDGQAVLSRHAFLRANATAP